MSNMCVLRLISKNKQAQTCLV